MTPEKVNLLDFFAAACLEGIYSNLKIIDLKENEDNKRTIELLTDLKIIDLKENEDNKRTIELLTDLEMKWFAEISYNQAEAMLKVRDTFIK